MIRLHVCPKGPNFMKKVITALSITATTLVGMLALATPAQAGEGHWSIGNGVQCRVILGVVVCSKNRA